jgi:HlyD family secretion protein
VEAKDYLAALKGEELPANATGTSLNAFEQAKLDVQTAQATLDSLQLVAPISGMITAVSAGLGDTVASGTIITISDVSKVTLDFYLDETDFDKVAVGYPVSVVFDSLPDSTFTGKVTSVDPSLSDQNGTSLIKGTAVLDSISPATRDTLLLGMSAAVDVIGGTAKNATLVSIDALHEIDTDQYGVYVLKNGKLEFTLVELGIKDSFNAVIKSGLQPGDVVSTGLLETN